MPPISNSVGKSRLVLYRLLISRRSSFNRGPLRPAPHLRLRDTDLFRERRLRVPRVLDFRKGPARRAVLFRFFLGGVRAFAARVCGWRRAKRMLFGATRLTCPVVRGGPFGRSAKLRVALGDSVVRRR